MDRYLQIAERVIALIRPKFYNRITWVVVLAGLLLVASPWWLDLVNALASKYLAVKLPASDSHIALGVTLVAFGLIYHLAVHYINELISAQREASTLGAHRDHDLKIFEAFVAQLSEDELAWILGDLQDQHAYTSPQGRKLDRAVQHLLAPSSQFIDKRVSEPAREFGLSVRELRNWISLNFFVYGPELDVGLRFCLYPDLNEDRSSHFPTPEQSIKYDGFAKQLYGKVDEVQAKYNAFRGVVKSVLAV